MKKKSVLDLKRISQEEFKRVEKQWTVIAIVLHVAGYVPIYLRNIDIYKSSMTLFVIATVFTFAIALFAYQIYHRTENGKK